MKIKFRLIQNSDKTIIVIGALGKIRASQTVKDEKLIPVAKQNITKAITTLIEKKKKAQI